MPCCPVNNVLRSTVLIVFSDAVKMFEDQSHCAVELAAKNPIEAQLIARHNDKLIPVLVRGEAMSTESFLKASHHLSPQLSTTCKYGENTQII